MIIKLILVFVSSIMLICAVGFCYMSFVWIFKDFKYLNRDFKDLLYSENYNKIAMIILFIFIYIPCFIYLIPFKIMIILFCKNKKDTFIKIEDIKKIIRDIERR